MRHPKFLALLLLILLVAFHVSGCSGGGAAFGLLGVAVENAFDTDDDPIPPAGQAADNTPVTVNGAIEVAGSGAPGVSPAPAFAFAGNGDAVEVWASLTGRADTYSRVSSEVVAAGTYRFTGPFRKRFLRLRHLPTGHTFALGRVSDDATTIDVPVVFDTMAVILTRILERQEAVETLICGSPAHTSLRNAAEARVKATVNNDLRLALAAVIADPGKLDATPLGFDAKAQGLKEMLILHPWSLGTLEVACVPREQVLALYSTNLFTFTLVSATASVFLTGTYIAGTAAVECTITSVSNFPVGPPFESMDQVGERFTIGSIAIASRERLTATVGGRRVTMTKYAQR